MESWSTQQVQYLVVYLITSYFLATSSCSWLSLTQLFEVELKQESKGKLVYSTSTIRQGVMES